MPPGLSLSVLVGQSVARSHRTKPSTPGTSAMSVSVTVCCPPSADAKRREKGADAPVIRMFMLATLRSGNLPDGVYHARFRQSRGLLRRTVASLAYQCSRTYNHQEQISSAKPKGSPGVETDRGTKHPRDDTRRSGQHDVGTDASRLRSSVRPGRTPKQSRRSRCSGRAENRRLGPDRVQVGRL